MKHTKITGLVLGLSIFFYTTSYGSENSNLDNSEKSIAGVVEIQTNIPSEGYSTGSTYTITISVQKTSCLKFGFELTAENDESEKQGMFFITNPIETQVLNTNNQTVTHTANGTDGNTTKTWSVDWTPADANGIVTFYVLGVAAENDLNTEADTITNQLSIWKNSSVSITESSQNTSFIFNKLTKTIQSKEVVNVYDIKGSLSLTTNNYFTNLSHLRKGIYILKSNKEVEKIILD